MGVPTHWGGAGNSGNGGHLGIYIPPPEHVHVIHFTRPIMDLCLAEERNPGMRLSRRWWNQPTLDIMRIRTGQAATEAREETGLEELEAEG